MNKTTFKDPCTLALETDEVLMQIHNPYVATLVEMGYDRADCEMVAAAGVEKTFPCVIHGRTFDTKEQYEEELADYLNGL
ncbi:hypothetical protein S-MbCM7_064 [Synechococcus phage ACG-2014h]|uniref:Uncharacterized protein n=1 Tax=Synechococcus phage ACG-2014h TaxID=1340810 RepID=V5US58_9CAUD|nr:hypothetical protein S-MbCM7_064 [Synechococcus phage ACG-2014h]AHB80478.1 hypothetical protein S-MbCM7_064 [Synechococcus phage ACG-2014h]